VRRALAGVLLTLGLGFGAGAGAETAAPVRATRCWEPPDAPTIAMAWAQDGPQPAPAEPPGAVGAIGTPGAVAMIADSDLAPKKRAWEESLGGREAAKLRVHARLAGWPSRLHGDRAALPAEGRAFLTRVAADTWRGLSAFTDRESGLPIDHVRFHGGVEPANAEIGDYTTVSSIGLKLASIVAAQELGLLSHEEAVARLRRVLATLERLETWRGFHFNFYDTTSLERTSHFVSFVDSAWLAAGLMVVRSAVPELAPAATALIEERDYGVFWDPLHQQMSHGFWVDARGRSPYHYATLYTEARVGSLIAIGKGDVPESHWFRMLRTFPPDCDWQSQPPKSRRLKTVRGHETSGGWYEWNGLRYVPSWGGSMFEALMPTLFVDERSLAPKSLGRNAEAHVEVQRRWATEVLGWPVWGLSPAVAPGPDGYREYGVPVLGSSKSYADVAVTPHAVALALAVAPEAATAALRDLASRYEVYGEFGFYDSVDPKSGQVATAYLSLDQGMLFLALANHLKDGLVQKLFAADPIAREALPILAEEDFFD
jgi:hypothetical protein